MQTFDFFGVGCLFARLDHRLKLQFWNCSIGKNKNWLAINWILSERFIMMNKKRPSVCQFRWYQFYFFIFGIHNPHFKKPVIFGSARENQRRTYLVPSNQFNQFEKDSIHFDFNWVCNKFSDIFIDDIDLSLLFTFRRTFFIYQNRFLHVLYR